MRVLISNDDGVSAPGIRALAYALSDFVDIEVMAPDRNRSGSSNSLSLSKPLRISKLQDGFYSVEGTPTDCVHLGLTGFLNPPMDMVVSGINDGSNLGDDILYSGTVAAAMEGRYLGLPAIAISLAGEGVNKNFSAAAEVAKHIVRRLIQNPLAFKTILNINVPDLPLEKIKGMQVTRLGTRHCAEPIVKTKDPRGRDMYWIGPPGLEADAGPGTDFYAISEGYVSITPLHLDMTHYKIFDDIASFLNGMPTLS